MHTRAFVRGISQLGSIVLSIASVGCTPDTIEIVVRDPFAVSVSQVTVTERTTVVPTQAPPEPPTDKIERAILASHFLGSWSTFHFDSPGGHHWTAWRYHRGGIEIGSRDFGSGRLLDDDGVITIGSADSNDTRITFDAASCELVIRNYRHRATKRYGRAHAYLDFEVRTPLSNVLQIRTVRTSAFSDEPAIHQHYP